jgi:hypothetical protein
MPFVNEVVEVTYAGKTIRGVVVEIDGGNIRVETPFGSKVFPSNEVVGLRFMAF